MKVILSLIAVMVLITGISLMGQEHHHHHHRHHHHPHLST